MLQYYCNIIFVLQDYTSIQIEAL